MKNIEYPIPLYDVTLHIVELSGKDDCEHIERFCNTLNINSDSIIDNLKNNRVDGGETFYDLNNRTVIVIIYPTTNYLAYIGIVAHEKRHVEDRILQYFGITDIESSAILAGYLGKIFYSFSNNINSK